MAGRTSTSFGVAATITILGILSLGFFVTTAVFFNKFYERQRTVDSLQSDQTKVVKSDERNREDVLSLIKDAEKERKSLVGYLIDSQSSIMARVTGSKRDTITELNKKLEGVNGADTASMLSLIQDRDSQIASLDANLKAADAARQQAQADRQNEVDRVKGIEENHQKTVDALSKEVASYKNEVEQYRSGADGYKARIDATLEKERNEAAESRKRLEAQLAKVSEEKLIVEGQLAALRGQKNVEAFRGRPEASLVDAQVIALNSGERQVIISIGQREKVVLGMTFAVYSDANSIKPDANGKYPAGKATIEVISISDTSATCRVTSEVKGNPIVKGDVVANAMFDPSKVYKFVAFGNFDSDRDGVATPLERNDVEAMITNWGGKIEPDLSGDADFLVLGQRPVLPPRPGQDAPFEVVQEFIRRQREVERYDALLKQAEATSIPVLNENRLYTLIGKTPARISGR
jgi:hypothetical protein